MATHVHFATWLENYGIKKLAQELSITKAAVYAWMRGKAAPKTTTLQKLVKLGKGKLSYDSIISQTTCNIAKPKTGQAAKKSKVIFIQKPGAKKSAFGVRGAFAKPALKVAATKKKQKKSTSKSAPKSALKPTAKPALKAASKKKSKPAKKPKPRSGATAVDSKPVKPADADPAFDS